ncbi:MAG: aspartate aminotransferase family protein [bacterium JZ-2024 1]
MENNLREQVIHWYQEHLNPTLARVFQWIGFDHVEVKAEGIKVWDEEGREYRDFLGGFGVFNFGHRNPRVLRSVMEQLERLPMSSRVFLSESTGQLAAELTSLFPPRLRYVFFSNSGAEAVECALKLSRARGENRNRILFFSGSFHGKTLGALSVTGREVYQKPFLPLLPNCEEIPYDSVEDLEKKMGEDVSAVIIEPIQGEGGIRLPAEGFLKAVENQCRKWGAWLIVDEIQTGFGRTGKNWGFEWENVEPDIVVVAKALGGGILPIGACIGTEEVWKPLMENPFLHTSTFGGNPLACAAGIAACRLLREENFAERARTLGEQFSPLLHHIQEKYSREIREIRGKGLMWGIEFFDPDFAQFVIILLRQKGFLTAYALNNPSVVRLEPPLIVEGKDLEDFARALDECIASAQTYRQAVSA